MVKYSVHALILIGLLVLTSYQCLPILPATHDKTVLLKGNQKTTPIETGKELYQKYCLTCHQADGGGVPFTFPSLIKSEWVNGDKTRLINILLNGLEGDITVGEDTFNGIMPKQNTLTDIQIATVLTFVRQNFDNKSGAITPQEVKILRNSSKYKL